MIVEVAMPFHPTIAEYLKSNPGFKDCLKVYNPERFTPLQTIIITRINEYPKDEIIGLFVLERSISKRSRRTFIQDYLVWHRDKDYFSHYTAFTNNEPNVFNIKEFWRKYGLGKYYGTTAEKPLKGDHGYKSISDLPDILQSEGKRIIKTSSLP